MLEELLSGGYEKNIMGSRQYIPLKLNASGVMPIIFAQAIMFVPGLVGGLDMMKDSSVGQWLQTEFAGIVCLDYGTILCLHC